MSDIFREVDEEIRREQAADLWKRYGNLIIGVAVLIVAVTAGYRGWDWYTARQAAERGERYQAALELAREGKHEEASAKFDEIAGEGGAIAVLARLRGAAELVAGGDTAAAAKAFDTIAADTGVSAEFRDLAAVRAGYILVDTASKDEIARRIEPLTADGSGWRNSAREIMGLSAYKAQDLAGAKDWFEKIVADTEAPQGMRGRAQLMLGLIAADLPAGTE